MGAAGRHRVDPPRVRRDDRPPIGSDVVQVEVPQRGGAVQPANHGPAMRQRAARGRLPPGGGGAGGDEPAPVGAGRLQ